MTNHTPAITAPASFSPNSDNTFAGASPFPDMNTWTVRSIRRGWNATQGCEQWELLAQGKTMQVKDRRIVVPSVEMMKLITANDPRVATMKKGDAARELLPPFKVTAPARGMYCYPKAYAALPMQRSEQSILDNRESWDLLDDLRKELGIGRGDFDRIVRPFYAQPDWYNKAAQALRDDARARDSKPKTGELDIWFPRDEPKETTVDDPATDALNARLNELAAQQSGNELTAPVDELTVWGAVTAPEGQRQFSAFNHFKRELELIDKSADVTKHILLALDQKPLGLSITQDGINRTCERLQLYLDNAVKYGLPKTALEKADVSQPQATTADNSVPSNLVPEKAPKSGIEESESKVSQHLLKVYPVDFGSIIHKGIRFSVTLCSDDATWDDAVRLMDQFAAHAECISETCKVGATPAKPANMTTLPAPTLPAPASAAIGERDSAGRVPGMPGTTVVTGVKRIKDEGKVIIELWAGGQYAEHRLSQASEHAFIAMLTNLDGLEPGTTYPVSWVADWITASKRATKGNQNYYRNVTGIRTAQSAAA